MTGRRPRAQGNVGRGWRQLRRTLGRAAFVALLVPALSACASGDLPQNFMAPEGPIARKIDGLSDLVFAVAIVVFFVVEIMLVAVLFKFRARGDETELPKQTHGNAKLEVLWTIIPALILAVIAVPTVRMIFDLSEPPEGGLEVRVIAKQYWWEFEYTGEEGRGVVTANELVIPVGRPVNLTMESTGQQGTVTDNPQDPGVIHSFWVPKLAGKQDIIPGQTRNLTIEAETAGRSYSGQCAEFCGLSHANMRFAVLAVEPAEFEAYLEEQSSPQTTPTSGDAARGAKLFAESTCIGCHAIRGVDGATQRVGPNLTRFAQREKFAGYMIDNDINDSAENVSAWLADPQAVKPGAQMPEVDLNDDQIADLVAYLRTLQ